MLKKHTQRDLITVSTATAAVLGSGMRTFGKEIGIDAPDLIMKPRFPYNHSALASYLPKRHSGSTSMITTSPKIAW